MTYRTDPVKGTRGRESVRSLWKVSLVLGIIALISIVALIIQGSHFAA